jgi:hypothetical protein
MAGTAQEDRPYHIDERAGKDEYAVVVSTLPDFWLHSFPNRDSALHYCKQFDLEIQGIIPFAI